MIAIAPTTAQYIAKYISLPFFTRLIMALHASKPEINALIKPIINGSAPMVLVDVTIVFKYA